MILHIESGRHNIAFSNDDEQKYKIENISRHDSETISGTEQKSLSDVGNDCKDAETNDAGACVLQQILTLPTRKIQ